jgi:hypothetical protein
VIQWAEVAQGSFTILDIDAEAVKLLIGFLYTGNYETPDDPKLEHDEDQRKKYRLHAEMVIAAEKYEIVALAPLAATNFRRAFFVVGKFQYVAISLAHVLTSTSYTASKEFYDTMADAWSFWRSPILDYEPESSDDDSVDDDNDEELRVFFDKHPEFAACLALRVNCDHLRCSNCSKEMKLKKLPCADLCTSCGHKTLDYFGSRTAVMATIWADMNAINGGSQP